MLWIERDPIKVNKSSRTTALLLRSEWATVRIVISENPNAAQRRAIARSLFKQMRPWLIFFGYRRNPLPKDLITMRRQSPGFEFRMARLEKGWTQEKLAQNSGISRRQILRIEAGQAVPDPRTRKAIEKALRTHA